MRLCRELRPCSGVPRHAPPCMGPASCLPVQFDLLLLPPCASCSPPRHAARARPRARPDPCTPSPPTHTHSAREMRRSYYSPLTYAATKLVLDGVLLRALPALLFAVPFYFLMGLNPAPGAFFTYALVFVAFNATVGALALALAAALDSPGKTVRGWVGGRVGGRAGGGAGGWAGRRAARSVGRRASDGERGAPAPRGQARVPEHKSTLHPPHTRCWR